MANDRRPFLVAGIAMLGLGVWQLLQPAKAAPKPSPTPTPTPTPVPPPTPQPTSCRAQYAVVSGDTGRAIASRYGVDWLSLYRRNEAVIEATARARGFQSSWGPGNVPYGTPGKGPGWWIFPGEVWCVRW